MERGVGVVLSGFWALFEKGVGSGAGPCIGSVDIECTNADPRNSSSLKMIPSQFKPTNKFACL